MDEVVAGGEAGFVADLVFDGDIGHVPTAGVAEDVGAVELFALFGSQYGAVFERGLGFVEHALEVGLIDGGGGTGEGVGGDDGRALDSVG